MVKWTGHVSHHYDTPVWNCIEGLPVHTILHTEIHILLSCLLAWPHLRIYVMKIIIFLTIIFLLFLFNSRVLWLWQKLLDANQKLYSPPFCGPPTRLDFPATFVLSVVMCWVLANGMWVKCDMLLPGLAHENFLQEILPTDYLSASAMIGARNSFYCA